MILTFGWTCSYDALHLKYISRTIILQKTSGLTRSARTIGRSRFLRRKDLCAWHYERYRSSQCARTLLDRLRIALQSSWQVRNRQVQTLEIKRAG